MILKCIWNLWLFQKWGGKRVWPITCLWDQFKKKKNNNQVHQLHWKYNNCWCNCRFDKMLASQWEIFPLNVKFPGEMVLLFWAHRHRMESKQTSSKDIKTHGNLFVDFDCTYLLLERFWNLVCAYKSKGIIKFVKTTQLKRIQLQTFEIWKIIRIVIIKFRLFFQCAFPTKKISL